MLGLGIGLGIGSGGATAGAADFDPTSVAGLLFDMNPAAGVTRTGADVTAVADQSGTADANKDMTAVGAPQFAATDADFNDKPSIEFTGDDALVSGTWAASQSQPFTVYVVGIQPIPAGTQFILDNLTTGVWFALRDNSGDGGPLGSLYFYAGNTALPTTAGGIDWASARVGAVVYNDPATRGDGYVNKYAAASANPGAAFTGTNVIDGVTLGSRNNGTLFFVGKLARVLVYSGAHDETTRQEVMTGLGALYGVTVTA